MWGAVSQHCSVPAPTARRDSVPAAHARDKVTAWHSGSGVRGKVTSAMRAVGSARGCGVAPLVWVWAEGEGQALAAVTAVTGDSPGTALHQ